jgi:hypothetical protein
MRLPQCLLCASLVALSCKTPTLTKVDLAAENKPPLAVTLNGSGITVPAGIGIAFVVTPYVDDKKSDDTVSIGFATDCVVDPGINKNEFFCTCGTPGMAKIEFSDSDRGSVFVPVMVTAQAGSVMWDGGLPEAQPPGDDASGE